MGDDSGQKIIFFLRALINPSSSIAHCLFFAKAGGLSEKPNIPELDSFESW